MTETGGTCLVEGGLDAACVRLRELGVAFKGRSSIPGPRLVGRLDGQVGSRTACLTSASCR